LACVIWIFLKLDSKTINYLKNLGSYSRIYFASPALELDNKRPAQPPLYDSSILVKINKKASQVNCTTHTWKRMKAYLTLEGEKGDSCFKLSSPIIGNPVIVTNNCSSQNEYQSLTNHAK
jgi:hypothetical protein